MQQTPLSALPEFSDSRQDPYGPDDVLPDGFRRMTAEEGDALDSTRRVLILDRKANDISLWSVESFSAQWGWRIALWSRGEVVDSLRLDDDDPDTWTAADIASGRPRRGPESANGRYVMIVPISTDDLGPLLRASLYPVLARQVLQETHEARAGWFHTSDGRYFASDADRRQHQRTLDEKAAREARLVELAQQHEAAQADRRGVA